MSEEPENGEAKHRTMIYLPKDLHQALRIHLAGLENVQPVTAFIEAAVREKLERATPVESSATGTRRRLGLEGERINFYAPADTAQRLREEAFRDRRSVSDAATEALVQWLARRAPAPRPADEPTDGDDVRRIVLDVPASTHKLLKQRARDSGMTVKATVLEALTWGESARCLGGA